MHTILGAGGVIGNELTEVLLAQQQTVRSVSRKGTAIAGTEAIAADLTDAEQTANAVKGSSIVYLLVGLEYKKSVWEKWWPVVMQNTINACKQHQAKLIFFDNVYALGKVNGAMTEDLPFEPDSMKGQIRAGITSQLLHEMNTGQLTAIVARAADFYGPRCKTSGFNSMVAENLKKGKTPQCLISADNKHSYTYTADCGKALWLLSQSETAFNQIWHLPTAHPALTEKEMIALACEAYGVPLKYTVLSKFMIKIVGFFVPLVKEIYEMLYQNEADYIFDSSKFEKAFNFTPTPYQAGIKTTIEYYKNKA
ncbi:MAG: NAD-dependent epimerase/dehydratase family protein [Ferruginibacter sp.]